jgi:hypothetical protein
MQSEASKQPMPMAVQHKPTHTYALFCNSRGTIYAGGRPWADATTISVTLLIREAAAASICMPARIRCAAAWMPGSEASQFCLCRRVINLVALLAWVPHAYRVWEETEKNVKKNKNQRKNFLSKHFET